MQRSPYTCSVIQAKRNFSKSPCTSSMVSTAVKKIKTALMGPTYKYSKDVLFSSGITMYACCTESVNAIEMIQELDLPDTLNSWFLITELHIWLCMVRLLPENEEGDAVLYQLLNSLWMDVEKRVLSISSPLLKKKALKHFYGHIHNAVLEYDEGLLGDDKELAGSIWRILYNMDENADPEKIALMVNYIRKQVAYLDNQKTEVILQKGIVFFHGLKDDVIEVEVYKKMNEIYNIKLNE